MRKINHRHGFLTKVTDTATLYCLNLIKDIFFADDVAVSVLYCLDFFVPLINILLHGDVTITGGHF